MRADRLEIREEADEDIRKAHAWYEAKRSGLGAEFLQEVGKVLDHIVLNPEAFQVWKMNLRQVPLEKFPYVLIYGIVKKSIVVYAVFHTHLNPNKKP